MSDEKPKPKPFAVCNRFDDERTWRSHISIDVAGRAIKYADFPITHPKENALTETAALLNSAVAAERRDAAATALREAAKDADCYAEDTMEDLGHQEGLLSDAIRLRVVRWLRARAAAVERGE